MNEQYSLRYKAIHSAIWKFLERFLAQIVSLIVSVVLARLLEPSDYSVVSICTIFFAAAAMIISGGLNTALIQKKDASAGDYTGILIISLIVSIIVYFVLFLFAPVIASFYNQPILVSVIRVMGLVLIINAYKSILCAYISARLQFKTFFFGTLIGTLISAVVGIIMALRGFRSWALVGQQMTNTIVDTIVLTIITKMPLSTHVSFKSLKSLFKYGYKIFITSMLQMIYSYLIPLFIGKKYTASDLSYYTKGRNFPDLILSSTSSTLSAVLFPVLAKFQDDNQALLHSTRRFIRVSSFVLFPLMLGLFAVSDNLVIVLLTEKWLPASQFIRIFCIANMFDMIHVGNCETIKAMGRSDIYLIIEIVKKTCYFITIAFFMWFGKNPVQLAEAFIVCTIIALCVNMIPNSRLIGYSLKMQVFDILENLLVSIVMCVSVSAVNYLKMNSLLKLFIQVPLGIFVYIAICKVAKNQNLEFIKNVLLFSLKKRDET